MRFPLEQESLQMSKMNLVCTQIKYLWGKYNSSLPDFAKTPNYQICKTRMKLWLSAEWIIDELSEASCVANETIYKGDQCQIFRKKCNLYVTINDEDLILKILYSASLPGIFILPRQRLFVPNINQLDHIYNSSVAWLSWRLVIPPGRPQQSIPFSSFEEKQPGLLGHNEGRNWLKNPWDLWKKLQKK